MRAVHLCIVVTLFLSSSAAAEGSKTYRNPYFNFTVNYPENWEAGEISGIAYFRTPREGTQDTFSENINIIVDNLTGNPVNLEQYTAYFFAVAPTSITGFQLVEKGTVVINGRDASFIVYASVQNGARLRHKLYQIVDDKKGYNLTYTALEVNYDTFLPQAEEIMRSFSAAPAAK